MGNIYNMIIKVQDNNLIVIFFFIAGVMHGEKLNKNKMNV
jgi:hypothetical protein